MARKLVKIALNKGGRNSRNLIILSRANDDAAFLPTDEYQYVASHVREVARSQDPSHSPTVDVRPIEDYHEIRLKGSILGKKNVRVFFKDDKERDTMVVLGVEKKENEGATPIGVKVRMRRRLRDYMTEHRPAAKPTRDEHKT